MDGQHINTRQAILPNISYQYSDIFPAFIKRIVRNELQCQVDINEESPFHTKE